MAEATGSAETRPPLHDLTDEQNERLLNFVRAYKKLAQMPARNLVNIALEYLHGNQMQELVIEELCSRVYPKWNEEDGCPVCGSQSPSHIPADDAAPCHEPLPYCAYQKGAP